ncbi:MAG: hypothetical protein MUP22_04680, partial [Desulfobacterales bacterium]|nr:hypothetical protein [Desulfobacterales bacterium]
FFSYDGSRQGIDGDADYTNSIVMGVSSPSTSAEYNLQSDLDNFSLGFIYGLPINCVNVGGEVKLAYHDEKQQNEWANNDGRSFLNFFTASVLHWWEANTLWFQVPYDSDYWDAQFKGSVNGQICPGGISPIDITLSVGGGFIFAGDNEYIFESHQSGVSTDASADLDGDVDGWNIGGDLWVRVPLSDGLSLPFLVRAEYSEKNREGQGRASDPFGNVMLVGWDLQDVDYTHEEKKLLVEAGGGIDMKLCDRSRLAAGLFYTYLDSSDDLNVNLVYVPGFNIYQNQEYNDKTPDYKEHRVSLKMGWETSLSDSSAIRVGFNTFYCWMDKDFLFDYRYSGIILPGYEKDVTTLDGRQWGIMASLGGSFKLQSVTLEPYLNAGYTDLDMDGDIHTDVNLFSGTLAGSATTDMDESRQEWFVGSGLSILFGN